MIPDRFKKEAKLMLLIPLALIIFGMLVSLFAPKISRQLDIDQCLGGGGKYDYENNQCISIEMNQNREDIEKEDFN